MIFLLNTGRRRNKAPNYVLNYATLGVQYNINAILLCNSPGAFLVVA